MGNLFKKLKILSFLKAVFTLVFFIHAISIGYNIKYPDHPSTKIFTKSLNEFDAFQLSFKLCVNELGNIHKRYSNLGYASIWAFYKGWPYGYNGDSDGIWVGWAGHSENHSTLSTVIGIFKVFLGPLEDSPERTTTVLTSIIF